MTIKAKRAKALPILDKEAHSLSSGVVDERITAVAEILIQSFNGQFGNELLEWFKRRIGRFRIDQKIADASRTKQEEVRLIKEAQLYLMEVMYRLEYLPPVADAYVNEVCWARHKRLFHGTAGVLAEFNALAHEADALLAIAKRKLDQCPPGKGAKPKRARDSLLSDTAGYILDNARERISKRKAAEIARDLLSATDVDVPVEMKEVERLIQQWHKGRNPP